MLLHGENPYRIRSYSNAYLTFRKLGEPIAEMSDDEIKSLQGIGDAITAKTRSLIEKGSFDTLDRYRSKTPEGVQEMLDIKGFGPKKIATIWKDLGVESVGELLYACNENRLVELKGFGQKTQEDLKKTLEYYLKSKDKFLFATVEEELEDLLHEVRDRLPDCRVEPAGAVRRKSNIVTEIELLIGGDFDSKLIFDDKLLTVTNDNAEGGIEAVSTNKIPVFVRMVSLDSFGSKWFRYTATERFMSAFLQRFEGVDFRNIKEESTVFEKVGLPFMEPELRESDYFLQKATEGDLLKLIEEKDIKGVVHCHTDYSDGLHSLRDMATAARDKGYSYILITDHSKSAFYANGLKEDRLVAQWEEIDKLNGELSDIQILKGIESDILANGNLDYSDDILKEFDCIIASVHSNLKMDMEKATTRLIRAIENPYTHILGHPTGRLLLARKGYPIDYQRVIDACAANGVAIELNANPRRLDLDWTWIPVAIEKGVKISINPDAHSIAGINDIHYGVLSARKGGLSIENCLNSLDKESFLNSIKSKK